MLMRFFIIHSEVDLENIKEEFQKLYEKSLEKWIKVKMENYIFPE